MVQQTFSGRLHIVTNLRAIVGVAFDSLSIILERLKMKTICILFIVFSLMSCTDLTINKKYDHEQNLNQGQMLDHNYYRHEFNK